MYFRCLMLIAVLSVICVPASQAGVPTASESAGVVTVFAGEGQARNQPAFVLRAEKKSFQLFQRSTRKLAGAVSSCSPRAYYQKYEFKNPYGVLLVGYYEQVYYCRSQGLVTYFYRIRWEKVTSIVPIVHWTPWKFDGHVPSGNDCAGEHCFIRGYKARDRTAVTEGSFHTCLIPIVNAGCNYLYPKLWITVHGDGSRPDSGWSD